MSKHAALLLIMAAALFCSSCSAENSESASDVDGDTDKALSSAAADEPSGSGDLTFWGQKNESQGSSPDDQPDQETLTSSGGSFVKYGSLAAFIPDQGGIAIADLDSGVYSYLSDKASSTLYFDGSYVYCVGDNGIFRIGSDGQSLMLSEDITYNLWLEQDKIYYIKQTDFSSDKPRGELWCMNTDGTNAVAILSVEIKGGFFIKNGWVYYTDAAGTGIYKIMLFGNAPVKLSQGQAQICLVTDYAVYYKELTVRQALRRIDLKTGTNVFFGAYGSVLEIDDTMYVMARRERSWGFDSLFSLAYFKDKEMEITYPIMFENIGEDQFCYFWKDYTYFKKSTGEIYRLNISDGEQIKESVSPYSTVFIDGKGYYMEGRSLMVYDCESAQVSSINQKKQ